MNELTKFSGLIDELYIGECDHTSRKGFGLQLFPSGFAYAGEWSDNKANGIGKIFFPNGNHAKGIFMDNNLLQGSVSFLDGTTFKGSMSDDNNCWFGTGKLTLPGGHWIDGVWVKRYLKQAKIIFPDKNTNQPAEFTVNLEIPKSASQDETELSMLLKNHLQCAVDSKSPCVQDQNPCGISACYANKEKTIFVVNGVNGLIINNDIGYLYSGKVVNGCKIGFGVVYSGKSLIAGHFLDNRMTSMCLQFDYHKGTVKYYKSRKDTTLAPSRVFMFSGLDISINIDSTIKSIDLPFAKGDQLTIPKYKKYIEDSGLNLSQGKTDYLCKETNGKVTQIAIKEFVGPFFTSPQIAPHVSFGKTFFSIALHNPSFGHQLEKLKLKFFQDQARYFFDDFALKLRNDPHFERLAAQEKDSLHTSLPRTQEQSFTLNASPQLPLGKISKQSSSGFCFEEKINRHPEFLLGLLPDCLMEKTVDESIISPTNYRFILSALIVKSSPSILPTYRKMKEEKSQTRFVTFDDREIEILEMMSQSDPTMAEMPIRKTDDKLQYDKGQPQDGLSVNKDFTNHFSFNMTPNDLIVQGGTGFRNVKNGIKLIDVRDKKTAIEKEPIKSTSTLNVPLDLNNPRGKNHNSDLKETKPKASEGNKSTSNLEMKNKIVKMTRNFSAGSFDDFTDELNDEILRETNEQLRRDDDAMLDRLVNELLSDSQLTPQSKSNNNSKRIPLEQNSILKVSIPFTLKEKTPGSQESNDGESFVENMTRKVLAETTPEMKIKKVQLDSLKKPIERIEEFIKTKLTPPRNKQGLDIQSKDVTPQNNDSSHSDKPLIIELSNSVQESSHGVPVELVGAEEYSTPSMNGGVSPGSNLFANKTERSNQEMDKSDVLSFANFAGVRVNYPIVETFRFLQSRQIPFVFSTDQQPNSRRELPELKCTTISKLLHRPSRKKLCIKFEKWMQTEAEACIDLLHNSNPTPESLPSSPKANPKYTCEKCLRNEHDEIFFKGIKMKGMKQGLCTVQYENGDLYTGMFVNDRKHGTGLLKSTDDQILGGQYDMDAPSGSFFRVKQNNFVKGYLDHGKFIPRVHRPYFACQVECDLNNEDRLEGLALIRCPEFELQCKFTDDQLSQSDKCRVKDLKSDIEMEGYLRLNKRCEEGFFENEATRELYRVNLKKAKLRSLDSTLD